MSLVMGLNIITIVARIVRFLPAHIHEDVNATRQLHCQRWTIVDGLINAMPNMQ